MNVLRCLGERFCKNATATFLVLFSLSACAADKGYPDKPTPNEPGPLKEITLTIDADGDLVIKDSNGKPIGDRCSADPKSKDACPIFKPGHRVQVEDIQDLSITKYHGSPQCYLVKRNGVYVIVPSAAYCNQ